VLSPNLPAAARENINFNIVGVDLPCTEIDPNATGSTDRIADRTADGV
jgi:hypothetical protein